jgi:hypothetical protein
MKQSNKAQKRRRRQAWIKRKNLRAKAKKANKAPTA